MPKEWTREELLLTFNLYCKIPFSKTKANNPFVIEVARLIGRTPSAVAMKLGNFGSFDPALKVQGISGLTGSSKADRAIWEEFNNDWENLAIESELATAKFLPDSKGLLLPPCEAPRHTLKLKDDQTITGPSETTREVKVRLHQKFFREVVFACYSVSCCVCRNPIPELLTAGHIIPWSHREDLRANPRNGLCLCSLHHDAFDCGLWCIDNSYKVSLSSKLDLYLPNRTIEMNFVEYSGAQLHLPDKFWPEQVFLGYHRENIFAR